MASPAHPAASSSKAGKGTNGLDEQEDSDAVGRPQLRVTLRMSDIIQLNLIIGRSRFGQVKLAKSRQTGDVYALKALQKNRCKPPFN